MGTNKRYTDSIDRRMDARIAERIMAEREPSTLTDRELERDEEAVTRTPLPRSVVAWVRYGEDAIRVDAEAVAWTAYAVAIRWTTPAGKEHRAWVWSSAVRARR